MERHISFEFSFYSALFLRDLLTTKLTIIPKIREHAIDVMVTAPNERERPPTPQISIVHTTNRFELSFKSTF